VLVQGLDGALQVVILAVERVAVVLELVQLHKFLHLCLHAGKVGLQGLVLGHHLVLLCNLGPDEVLHRFGGCTRKRLDVEFRFLQFCKFFFLLFGLLVEFGIAVECFQLQTPLVLVEEIVDVVKQRMDQVGLALNGIPTVVVFERKLEFTLPLLVDRERIEYQHFVLLHAFVLVVLLTHLQGLHLHDALQGLPCDRGTLAQCQFELRVLDSLFVEGLLPQVLLFQLGTELV